MSRKTVITAVAILFLLLLAGCRASALPGGEESTTDSQELIHFLGKVVYVPIEGGFFGLIDERGKQYDPGSLPEPFRRDGLAVKVDARQRQASVGFHMWGQKIEVLEIQPL